MSDTKDTRPHSFKVKDLASNGIQSQDIAKYLGITKDQLVNEYADILNVAAIDRTCEVAHNLYLMALDGNVQATIYWLRCVGKWEEMSKAKEEFIKDDTFSEIKINLVTKDDVKDS